METMLTRLGFTPTTDSRTKVILNRQEDVLRYYLEVGTHNAYQLERLQKFGRECWGKDLSEVQLAE